MREIKFRAWDKFSNEMVDVKTIDFGNDGAECAVDKSGINGEMESEWILEQYTGLHDKNGKEIYEGDVVKVVGLFGFEFTGEVVYDRFGFNLKDFWCSGFDDPDLAFSEKHDWQVIGNIHDNQEILEKKHARD